MSDYKNELDALLHDAHMTRAELARKFDIAPRSISQWNKSGIPQYAIAYLEQRAKIVDLYRSL